LWQRFIGNVAKPLLSESRYNGVWSLAFAVFKRKKFEFLKSRNPVIESIEQSLSGLPQYSVKCGRDLATDLVIALRIPTLIDGLAKRRILGKRAINLSSGCTILRQNRMPAN
jgi:hypothetical protein